MGSSPSKLQPGLIVTLDALGTIYKFREPISTQYIKVAKKCGLNSPIDEKELMKAFKSSFEEISAEYPNYGKGQLTSPRAWWKSLTNDTFRKIVDEDKISESLPDELYNHFTSNAAYELFPDVEPFMSTMRELKDQYPRPGGPGVFVGVISNGDTRVKGILSSLGLRVGIEKPPKIETFLERAYRFEQDQEKITQTPWHNVYNSRNDFDMLVTSYEVGAEKPDSLPFLQAEVLAKMNYTSRLQQQIVDWKPTVELAKTKIRLLEEARLFDQPTCIHIGDDYVNDYFGATSAEFQALHLARNEEDMEVPAGTNIVRDLDEAAMAIRILAAEKLGNATAGT